MINGIQIHVSTEELKQLIQKRELYHMEKEKWYESQLNNLKSGGVRPEAVSNDPISSLEQSQQRHADKRAYFNFLANHLIPNESYTLTDSDLIKLEIISRYF